MGYEIAGGWGAKMATPDAEVIVMVGDGSYLLMNSDIYSSVLTGHKLIVVLCDNAGFAVINRLQNFKGVPSFNNLLRDCRIKSLVRVDFARHAEAMGAIVSGHVDVRGFVRPSAGARRRSHHGHRHRYRSHDLDAGRCLVGCGRARRIESRERAPGGCRSRSRQAQAAHRRLRSALPWRSASASPHRLDQQ